MASPFRVFRKHQKVMLAVVGLLAMISFVFLPVIMDRMSVQTQEDPVVVTTTEFGDLRERDMQMLMYQRGLLLAFLERMQGKVLQAGGQPYAIAQVLQRIGPASEESVVMSWLLAQEAQRLGLTIDDAAVNEMLTVLADQRLSSQQVDETLREVRLSQGALFESMKSVLLTMRMEDLFQVSLAGITPGERWDYFQRMNRKGTVESAAVPVVRFIDQVADPDEATLTEFFDKYKKDYPNPASPEPGFRIPHRVEIEYFKADYNKFAQATKVSDEDVRKYYEEHKEDYKREPLPSNEPTKGPVLPSLPEPAAPATKATEPEKKSESVPAKASEGKAQEKPESAASKASKDEAEKKTDTKPAETAAPKKDSSSVKGASPFRFVSYGENSDPAAAKDTDAKSEPKKAEKTEATKAAPAEKPAATPPSPAPQSPAKETTAKETTAKEAPAAEKPAPKAEAAKKEAPAATSEKATTPEKPEAKPAAGAAAEKPKPTEYLPLKDVQDEIRRQLARQRTREAIDKLFDGLKETLNAYNNEWTLYDASVQDNTAGTTQPPVRPDFVKLSAGTALEARKTGLITPYEAIELDLGKSQGEQGTFLKTAFAQSLLKFRPLTSEDIEGNRYLFWKVGGAEEQIPKLSDSAIHQEVLHTWKMVQARSLAKAEATKLAEEARKANKPLKDVFAGRQGITVMESGPFSWLTYGSLPQMAWNRRPPMLSTVEGVDAPGPDFMRTVFRLAPGEVGVATNEPETVSYVVRAVKFTPSPDVLWTMFLEEHVGRYMAAAAQDAQETMASWLNHLRQSSGLEWKRDPARPRDGSR